MSLETVGVKLVTEGEAQFLDAMRKAGKAVDGVGESSQNAQKPAKGLSVVALALGTALGQALFNAAIQAGQALVGFAKDSITAASDLQETVSKTKVVFDDQSEAVLAFGKNSATALGMSENSALSAASTYGNLFRSMGIGTEASSDMSMELVKLAADLASFNNMAPEEVLEKLRAGLVGEAEPLKSLGININEMVLKEKAMELGLYNGTGALNAQQKAQAAYAVMLEQSMLAQGDFARTSGGLANQQRIAKAQLENTKALLGEAFLPVVTMATKALNNMLSSPGFKKGMESFVKFITTTVAWIEKNWPTISKTFQEVWAQITAGIQVVVEIIRPILEALTKWWTAHGQEVMKVVKVLWDFIVALFTFAATLIGAIVRLNLKIIEGLWRNYGAIFIQVVTFLWNVISAIFTTAISVITSLFKAFTALLRGDFQGFADYLREAWNNLWSAIRAGAEAAWNGIVTWFQGVIKKIKDIFTGVNWKDIGLTIIQGIWDGLKNGWAWLVDKISGLAKELLDIVKKILNIKSPSEAFAEVGRNISLGLGKGILEGAKFPLNAVMSTTQALAPMATAVGSNSYSTSYTNQYNLQVTTMEGPGVVQKSFAMMQMLGG